MKIALLGTGKMSQAVHRLAEPLGHQIIIALDSKSNPASNRIFQGDWVTESEALIDFSAPEAAVENILRAGRTGLPIVQGTTGWYDRIDWLGNQLQEIGGSCVYSSNFSLGMQLFFRVISQVATLMAPFSAYVPYLSEQHHGAKKDAPSGTALRLLEILENHSPNPVPTTVLRAGSIPGTHEVAFDSPEDTLLFRHTARNRNGFARGALLAAELIQERQGFFEFQEILFDEK